MRPSRARRMKERDQRRQRGILPQFATGGQPSRWTFLAASGALAAIPARAFAAPVPDGRLKQALVLSGGGARGAYEAGIVDYLRASQSVPDGAALPPYGFVAGTSVGALNGYFVATGQYTLLRSLWYQIAEQRVIVLKRDYAKILDPDSGLGNRAFEGARLILRLTRDDTGVADGAHLHDWLAARIDPDRPVLVPFVWTVTNLSTQAPEFFYLLSSELTPEQRANEAAALRAIVAPNVVVREATPDILVDALRASAAIPIAFDPVALPSYDGTSVQYYVDGGVTANTPVAIARTAARRIDVVLLDPPFQKPEYKSAIDVGYGVFGAMQRRILEADLRAAYLQRYVTPLYPTEIFQIQPRTELKVAVGGFNDRANIYAAFVTGFEDARSGFVPYEFSE